MLQVFGTDASASASAGVIAALTLMTLPPRYCFVNCMLMMTHHGDDHGEATTLFSHDDASIMVSGERGHVDAGDMMTCRRHRPYDDLLSMLLSMLLSWCSTCCSNNDLQLLLLFGMQ